MMMMRKSLCECSKSFSPIHVAVMLRNLRLVQRFSIVLKALGHTVDVTNRQDEVGNIFKIVLNGGLAQ